MCGQIVAMIKQTGAPIVCCGKPMTELIAGTTDASVEKHVPVVKVENGKVCVSIGQVTHPMSKDHYIEWISLQTKKGNQSKVLSPETEPYVEFLIDEDDVVEAVYAYCNLHGLWKA